MAMKVPTPVTSGPQPLGGEQYVPLQAGYFNLSHPTPPMKTFDGMRIQGAQLAGLGEALSDFGLKAQKAADENALLQIENNLYELERRLYDPATGIGTQFGANAIGMSSAVQSVLKDFMAEQGLGTLSPAGKRAAERMVLGRSGQIMSSVEDFERKQIVTNNTELLSANIEQQIDRAIRGDDGEFNNAMANIDGKVDALAEYMGWSPEHTEMQRQIYTTAAVVGRANALAVGSATRSADPVAAVAYLDDALKNNLLDPETHSEAMSTLKPAVLQFHANNIIAQAGVDDWNERFGTLPTPTWEGYDTSQPISLGTVAEHARGEAGKAAQAARQEGTVAQGVAGRGAIVTPSGTVATGPMPELTNGVMQLAAAAAKQFGGQLTISSGYRPPEMQADIMRGKLAQYGLDTAQWDADRQRLNSMYGVSAGAVQLGLLWEDRLRASGVTKWVAPPGMSNHQRGAAADLSWNGAGLGAAPAYVQEWIHQNAAAYGLSFPMSWEPWHVEVQGVRGSSGYRMPGRDGGVGYAADSVQGVIVARANSAGIDPALMLMLAHIETGGTFDPKAKNPTSTASGIYQMMEFNWDKYGLRGDPFDLELGVAAGLSMVQENVPTLRANLGREPTPGEIYLAHQQGAAGASKLIKADPMALAAGIVGHDAVKLNGGNPATMTAGEFAALWINKGNETYAQYAQGGGGGAAPVPYAPGMSAPSGNPYGMSAGAARIYNLPTGTADEQAIRAMAMQGYQQEQAWIDQQQNRQKTDLIDTLTTQFYTAGTGSNFTDIVTPEQIKQLGADLPAVQAIHSRISSGADNVGDPDLMWSWSKKFIDAAKSGDFNNLLSEWENPAVQLHLRSTLSANEINELREQAKVAYAAKGDIDTVNGGGVGNGSAATAAQQAAKIPSDARMSDALTNVLAGVGVTDPDEVKALLPTLKLSMAKEMLSLAGEMKGDMEGDIPLYAVAERLVAQIGVPTPAGLFNGALKIQGQQSFGVVLQTIDKVYADAGKTTLDLIEEGFEVEGVAVSPELMGTIYDGYADTHPRAPSPSELIAMTVSYMEASLPGGGFWMPQSSLPPMDATGALLGDYRDLQTPAALPPPAAAALGGHLTGPGAAWSRQQEDWSMSQRKWGISRNATAPGEREVRGF